jgi:hypothetical protein
MISSQQMAEAFERNVQIIKMQTKGITQAESLIQLPFRANCMNWIVGHILIHRNFMLDMLGQEPALPADALARYARESEPILGEEPGVLPIETLVEALERSQERLGGALGALSAQDLEREVPGRGGRKTRLGSALFFTYFHDTYHTGQTEVLRQASGKDDKVI